MSAASETVDGRGIGMGRTAIAIDQHGTSAMTARGWAAALAALVAVAVVALLAAPAAHGAFGDEFGVAPINGDGPGEQEVPALPGESHAFWAGVCDRGAAPAIGEDLEPHGGIGSRPATVFAPTLGPPASVPAPATAEHCLDTGWVAGFDFPSPWEDGLAPQWRMPAATQAGAHPDGTSMLQFNRGVDTSRIDGSVDNVYVDLPAGFVGNPQAVAQCPSELFDVRPMLCPPESQVGVLRLNILAIHADANRPAMNERIHPVYNLEPREGNVAEVGFAYIVSGYTNVRLVAKARTNGDFGVTAFTGQIPSTLPPVGQSITLWGVPWAAENDLWRAKVGHREGSGCATQPGVSGSSAYLPWSGLTPECEAPYEPDWGPIEPFLTNETDCNPAPTVGLAVDSYQNPGSFTSEGDPVAGNPNWKRYQSVSPPVTGCEELEFEPQIDFEPTSRSADGASGLDVELRTPQNNDPPAAVANDPGDPDDPQAGAPGHWRSAAGRATAHLKDTVVTLPRGLSVNPSSAAGLQGCTDAQIGLRQLGDPPLFNNGDPFNEDGGADGAECPDASKIGTVAVHTPLLGEPLTGELVLGQPKSTDPRSGEMLRMFVVARLPERGLIAKIYGSAVADPATGQLTTTFRNNPEVPFEKLTLDVKGGQRGMLALPQRCGSAGWRSAFTPWSSVGAPVDVPDAQVDGAFAVDANCAFGFAPTLRAGMSTEQARESGTFSFRFTRRDGEQRFAGLTAKLPAGLLASVKHVQLCPNARANAGACPLESQIGIVDAGAGSGMPFFLERPGRVYLTEGYKGGEYGLMVRVPVEAGPFRGPMALSPIVIRQALHVDRTTAQVTAISDPLPQIWHGIPLRVRQVTAIMDRPGFMLNPSDCAPKQIRADLRSPQGTLALPVDRFQATGCPQLRFRPRLAMALRGRRQLRTGGHPAIRAVVRQRAARRAAGIERAVVRLPRSLALDPANAQALCEFEDGTKPDLEHRCPDGSIVGRARAVSPLLKEPLAGDVYFVKNVRIDEETGNAIRTLPMIVVALRGEIAVNLRGESSVDGRNRLVNTFANVPDAPVSQFNLNIRGGRNGIITVTRTARGEIDLCSRGSRRQIAEADMDAHSGRRSDRGVRLRTACPKARKVRCRTVGQKRTRVCKRRAAQRRGAATHGNRKSPRVR